jgi:hypothetical protein
MSPGARSSGEFPDLALADLDGKLEPLRGAWREGLAERMGVAGALFEPRDRAPAFRPG